MLNTWVGGKNVCTETFQRPQVQERLTIQISAALKEVLQHNDVAVVIEADHLCVASRGIKDAKSTTQTFTYSG